MAMISFLQYCLVFYSTSMRDSLGEIVYLLFLFGQIVSLMAEFQQQRAKVVHANPKYIKSVSIFTTRQNRSSPYSTDVNMTMLADWGNNSTIKTMYYKLKAKTDAVSIELKTCDMIKLKWVKDWVEKYSNMSTDTCPLKLGVYRFTGFEVPPKNFPIQLLFDKNSDYETTLLVYVTKTKETVLEISVGLTFQRNTKGKRTRNKV